MAYVTCIINVCLWINVWRQGTLHWFHGHNTVKYFPVRIIIDVSNRTEGILAKIYFVGEHNHTQTVQFHKTLAWKYRHLYLNSSKIVFTGTVNKTVRLNTAHLFTAVESWISNDSGWTANDWMFSKCFRKFRNFLILLKLFRIILIIQIWLPKKCGVCCTYTKRLKSSNKILKKKICKKF